MRLECCECHNHPFDDNLKQKDFWGVAAFFNGMHANHTAKKDEGTPAIVERFLRSWTRVMTRNGFDDPVYKKNVQRLIERNRKFEEENKGK